MPGRWWVDAAARFLRLGAFPGGGGEERTWMPGRWWVDAAARFLRLGAFPVVVW